MTLRFVNTHDIMQNGMIRAICVFGMHVGPSPGETFWPACAWIFAAVPENTTGAVVFRAQTAVSRDERRSMMATRRGGRSCSQSVLSDRAGKKLGTCLKTLSS